MSESRRLTRAEIDALWERGEIRPWHEGTEFAAPRPIDTTFRRGWRDPEKAVLRAKAAAASRRRQAERRGE